MSVVKAAEGGETPPENVDIYMDLTAKDVARIVLSLLVEEALRRRLAEFRRDARDGVGQSRRSEGAAQHPADSSCHVDFSRPAPGAEASPAP